MLSLLNSDSTFVVVVVATISIVSGPLTALASGAALSTCDVGSADGGAVSASADRNFVILTTEAATIRRTMMMFPTCDFISVY